MTNGLYAKLILDHFLQLTFTAAAIYVLQTQKENIDTFIYNFIAVLYLSLGIVKILRQVITITQFVLQLM